MQQYFINELQRELFFNQQTADFFKHDKNYIGLVIQQLTFNEIETILESVTYLIIQHNSDVHGLYFVILLKQYLREYRCQLAKDQQTEFLFKIFGYLVRILQYRNENPKLSVMLEYFIELTDPSDTQFWIVAAWYFRNDAQNLVQIELLRLICFKYPQNIEFFDIFILKLKVLLDSEADKNPKIIIKCLKQVAANKISIVEQNVTKFILKQIHIYMTKDIAELIQIIINQIIESKQIQDAYLIQFIKHITISTVRRFIDRQNDYDCCVTIHSLLRCFTAVQEIYQLKHEILRSLFKQICEQLQKPENQQIEINITLSKLKHESLLCKQLLLLQNLIIYLPGFFKDAFGVVMSCFELTLNVTIRRHELYLGKAKMIEEYSDFNIKFEYTEDQQKAILIMLFVMTKYLVKTKYMKIQYQEMMRTVINPLMNSKWSQNYQQILISLLTKVFKRLFKEDDDLIQQTFLKYLAVNIVEQQDTLAINALEKVLKSQYCSDLVYYNFFCIHDVILEQIIHSCNPDYPLVIKALIKHNVQYANKHIRQIFELVILRIDLDIQNQNYHSAINYLKIYTIMIKIEVQKDEPELIVDENKILSYLNYQFIEEEAIDLIRIYLKCSNYQNHDLLVESIIQIMKIYSDCSANCVLKFFKSLFQNTGALLYDINQQLLEKVFQFVDSVHKRNIMPLKSKQLLKTILRKTPLSNINQYIMYVKSQFNIHDQVEIMMCICTANFQDTIALHFHLLDSLIKLYYDQIQFIGSILREVIKYINLSLSNYVNPQLQYGQWNPMPPQMIIELFRILINLLQLHLIQVDSTKLIGPSEKTTNQKQLKKRKQKQKQAFRLFENYMDLEILVGDQQIQLIEMSLAQDECQKLYQIRSYEFQEGISQKQSQYNKVVIQFD
ncbi:hypothetical protein pb186bvf_005186 [Paramecium bursaria]